jgi:hypothetical protein
LDLEDENGFRVELGLGDAVLVPAIAEKILLDPAVKSRLLEVYIT